MAEDWFADVQKHHPGADETVVRKLVTYLGIALRNRDSSLVSFSDPDEVARVRERFLRKKLALTEPDERLDEGLLAVRNHMAGDRTKNRVTVYYLLADWFGKHDLFGGSASAPGSFSFGSASAAAAGPTGQGAAHSAPVEPARTVEPVAAAASAPAPPQAAFETPGGDAPRGAAHSNDEYQVDDGAGWPSWLTWLLIAAAVLLLLFFLLRR